jgi:UDP-N-acetylglucosamine diphosphorylase/glucosamine-1-phosphate N-acetyltransferase
MNYILFGDARRNNLLPLTFLRPVADIRFGILTIREKWEKYLGVKTSTLTEKYLRKKFPVVKEPDNILINGSICPNDELIGEIRQLQPNQALVKNDVVIAMRLTEYELDRSGSKEAAAVSELQTQVDFIELRNVWDIFALNDTALRNDYDLITKNRKSQPINDAAKVIGAGNVFVEEGAKIGFAVINAEKGPVYIGKNAEIMEGSLIRGPFALCDHAVVKMGAKIYGATTIGPHSKVGGEINNSVIFGYSNKAHDGFLGHSVIAEWCNLGADTNTSNLKNTYDSVRIWSYPEQTFIDTGQQFCGLIMGDHSKSGINTMFNTGTVVGVSANIFGGNFQRNFISSFVWGGHAGFTTYDFNKAMKVAAAVYRRRNLDFGETERDILYHIFNTTFEYRNI